MGFLSPTERMYLQDASQLSKKQQRDIRHRLRKKLRTLGEELGQSDLVLLESRDAAAGFRDAAWSSLVRLPPCSNNERKEEEWAGSELNQRPPPCQGGILTRLDHRPNIQ